MFFKNCHKNFSMNLIKKISYEISYPYRFGGMTQCSKMPKNQLFLKKCFGNQFIDNLKQAYFSTIHAIANADKQQLSATLVPNLYQKIKFQKVLITNHEKDQIQAYPGQFFAVLYGDFDRKKNEIMFDIGNFQQQDKKHQFQIYVNSQKSITAIFKAAMTQNIKILFCFITYFQSGLKLLKFDQSKNISLQNLPQGLINKKQIHSVQFQFQCHVEKEQIESIINKPQLQTLVEILSSVLKKQDYEIRIGDIDDIMKKNLQNFIS